MRGKKFLTAEWRKLIMANYKIDPSLLKKYIPANTELDYFNDNCYVSLVGFMFKKVRVKGLVIPFHINFPEVNLRFYVRHFENNEWKRGVVFINEIVPKPAITFIANRLYNEHYSTLPMQHYWQNDTEGLNVGYRWKKKGHWNKLEVKTEPGSRSMMPGSEEEFITEHFWGYSRITADKTAEYHVSHPRWDIYPVKDYQVDCDFEDLYGYDFLFLKMETPCSVFLAEGSPVTVFSKRVL